MGAQGPMDPRAGKRSFCNSFHDSFGYFSTDVVFVLHFGLIFVQSLSILYNFWHFGLLKEGMSMKEPLTGQDFKKMASLHICLMTVSDV